MCQPGQTPQTPRGSRQGRNQEDPPTKTSTGKTQAEHQTGRSREKTKRKEEVTKPQGRPRSGRTPKGPQEEHPGQFRNKDGKEGAGHVQEAKRRNIGQTRARKDKKNAFSQLPRGEKNTKRTVDPPGKGTQNGSPTDRRRKPKLQARAPTQGSTRAKEGHARSSKDKDKRTTPCQGVPGSTSTPTGQQDNALPPQGR